MSFQAGCTELNTLDDALHRSKWDVNMIRSRGFDPAELSIVADALQRYHFYQEQGISNYHIMHLQEEWLQNILSLVPRDQYSGIPDATYRSLIQQGAEEIKADFAHSMRKTIIDYLLKSPVERRWGLTLHHSQSCLLLKCLIHQLQHMFKW